MFATAGDALWVFTGYTGVAFDAAIQLSATAWTNRDLVSIGDHDNDGSADLLWRDHSTARLLLRHGKPATGGAGADLLSLASAASSKSGVDAQYGNGWTSAVMPLMTGSADVNKDGIPDIWAITGAADNGIVRFYPGGATHHADPVGVIFVDWRTHKALGEIGWTVRKLLKRFLEGPVPHAVTAWGTVASGSAGRPSGPPPGRSRKAAGRRRLCVARRGGGRRLQGDLCPLGCVHQLGPSARCGSDLAWPAQADAKPPHIIRRADRTGDIGGR